MSSCYCLKKKITINSSNVGPAWARLNEYRLHLEQKGFPVVNMGLLVEKLKAAPDLKAALSILGWDFAATTRGTLCLIDQTHDQCFEEPHWYFWTELAPFVENGSFFAYWDADEVEIYRWRFEDGVIHVDVLERMIWTSDDFVLIPREEALDFVNRLHNGVDKLRKRIESP